MRPAKPTSLLLISALLAGWGADSMAQGQVVFKSVDLALSGDGDLPAIHPVNITGGPELELVVVQGAQATVFLQTAQGFARGPFITFPAPETQDGSVYYGFARLTPDATYTLLTMSSTGLTGFPIPAEPAAPIVPVPVLKADVSVNRSEGLPQFQYFDMALDLNGDDMDELLLPESSGFSIGRVAPDGGYRKVALPRDAFKRSKSFSFSRDVPPDSSRVPFVVASLEARAGVDDLLFYDANGDGLLDLIYTSTGNGTDSKQVERYDIFLQEENLTFGKKPYQSIAVPYDSQADATFRDINKDKRLDAVLVRSNLDILNPRTVVKFFVGDDSAYQVFSKESDRFVTRDPMGLVQLADFNADSIPDFAMTYFSYQFGSVEDIVDLAFSNKIRFKLQFYLGRGKGGYNRQADFEKEIILNAKMDDFRGSPPVTAAKDMNGDGLMDLVVRSSDTQLDLYFTSGKVAYPARPNQSFNIPEDASLSFTDINSDGLEDIIVSSAQKRSCRFIYSASSPR